MTATVAAAAATVVLVPAGLAAAAPSPIQPDLRADTNRDGVVDVQGASDEPGEEAWTANRGAILLPNMDDDARRCPTKAPGGKPLSDAKLAACRDGSDAVVNGGRDAADLARLRTVPMPGAGAQARGAVTVTGAAAKHTRIFVNRSGRWVALRPSDRLTAAEVRRGVELGIEATDVVRDSRRWDGRVPVRFSVTGGTASSPDTVMFRVAPVLTHHHLQPVQRVAVTAPTEGAFRTFVKRLGREVKAAGITQPMFRFSKYGDIWAQDFFEPGYVSMPGPGGRPTVMRMLIRSAQPRREAGRELLERLRGPDVGVVQVPHKESDTEDSSLNSMGNLETIPPYTHSGKSYPAGRIIMGQRPEGRQRPSAQMLAMLRAQSVQAPLLLDTGWLRVGHVDEFVQFLPASTPRGWRIGVADPDRGLALLRDAERAGHGRTKMFHGLRPGERIPTIAQVLANRKFLSENARAVRKITSNLAILKRETGVTDEEIIRVPALFHGESMRAEAVPSDVRNQIEAADDGGAQAREPETSQLGAFVPGAVNGIVLGRDRYLAPDPHGPLIGGKDIFREAIGAAYRGAGLTPRYIDDWYTYHVGEGEVHCGTNTLRDARGATWWTPRP
jgi:protein-arginine deiminase